MQAMWRLSQPASPDCGTSDRTEFEEALAAARSALEVRSWKALQRYKTAKIRLPVPDDTIGSRQQKVANSPRISGLEGWEANKNLSFAGSFATIYTAADRNPLFLNPNSQEAINLVAALRRSLGYSEAARAKITRSAEDGDGRAAIVACLESVKFTKEDLRSLCTPYVVGLWRACSGPAVVLRHLLPVVFATGTRTIYECLAYVCRLTVRLESLTEGEKERFEASEEFLISRSGMYAEVNEGVLVGYACFLLNFIIESFTGDSVSGPGPCFCGGLAGAVGWWPASWDRMPLGHVLSIMALATGSDLYEQDGALVYRYKFFKVRAVLSIEATSGTRAVPGHLVSAVLKFRNLESLVRGSWVSYPPVKAMEEGLVRRERYIGWIASGCGTTRISMNGGYILAPTGQGGGVPAAGRAGHAPGWGGVWPAVDNQETVSSPGTSARGFGQKWTDVVGLSTPVAEHLVTAGRVVARGIWAAGSAFSDLGRSTAEAARAVGGILRAYEVASVTRDVSNGPLALKFDFGKDSDAAREVWQSTQPASYDRGWGTWDWTSTDILTYWEANWGLFSLCLSLHGPHTAWGRTIRAVYDLTTAFDALPKDFLDRVLMLAWAARPSNAGLQGMISHNSSEIMSPYPREQTPRAVMTTGQYRDLCRGDNGAGVRCLGLMLVQAALVPDGNSDVSERGQCFAPDALCHIKGVVTGLARGGGPIMLGAMLAKKLGWGLRTASFFDSGQKGDAFMVTFPERTGYGIGRGLTFYCRRKGWGRFGHVLRPPVWTGPTEAERAVYSAGGDSRPLVHYGIPDEFREEALGSRLVARVLSGSYILARVRKREADRWRDG
ncbi:unnamed protein product [Pylaiella littoralis]